MTSKNEIKKCKNSLLAKKKIILGSASDCVQVIRKCLSRPMRILERFTNSTLSLLMSNINCITLYYVVVFWLANP